MDKKFIELSEELTELGMNILTACRQKRDLHGVRVGNILQLFGAIIANPEDTLELDDFLRYFSGKKLLEGVNPIHLQVVKKISESPELKGMMDVFTKSVTDDNCDDCPAKDTCTDRHCSNSGKSDETDGPKPKKRKPAPKSTRKRKPKSDE